MRSLLGLPSGVLVVLVLWIVETVPKLPSALRAFDKKGVIKNIKY